MATNMAPHNLQEVVAAVCHLIDHPDATLDEVMAFVPGPDLPTGGTIVGIEGIREAYETGRGSFKTRATVSTEHVGPRKTGLVVTELPYLVGPERVIEKIKDAVNAKKLLGISDVTDLTDRHHGLRLVIGVKSGFDPEAVLQELYRLTPLEENFSINSVALVEGQPQTLGLKALLQVYIDHRIKVITRRSRYRLEQRQKRLHLVEGLLTAITDIDTVIEVIRSSDDATAAKNRLQEVFRLTDEQTEYILELRLRRLTKFSRLELDTEQVSLTEEIVHLTTLLSSEEAIRQTVASELRDIAKAYGTPRRSHLSGLKPHSVKTQATQGGLEIPDAPCLVLVSQTGFALRVQTSQQRFPGTNRRSPHDALMAQISTRLRGRVGAITSTGILHIFHPMDLPEGDGTVLTLSRGVSLVEYLGMDAGDGVVVGLCSLDEEPTVVLGTVGGVVKRVKLANLPERTQHSLMSLKDGDRIVGAATCADNSQIVFITRRAQLLRFSGSFVRPQGLSASGMAGISLAEDDQVVFVGAHSDKAEVMTVSGSSAVLPGTEAQRFKRTPLGEFPAKGRATGGVRAHSFLKGEDHLVLAYVGASPLALGPKGQALELPEQSSKRDASGIVLSKPIALIGEALTTG
jgi:DNA gyrase subunit A